MSLITAMSLSRESFAPHHGEAFVSFTSFDREHEIAPDQLSETISQNMSALYENVDGDSGLLPAANIKNRPFNKYGHYDDAWIRDWSFCTDAVVEVASIQGESGAEVKKDAQEYVRDNLKKPLNIISEPFFQERFLQPIETHGDGIRRLTREAPPIHLTIKGAECEWPRQNQPDSWGALLSVYAKAHKNGLVEYSDREISALRGVADHLIEAEVERFECSSMWEDIEVHSPPPTSTLMLVGRGLSDVASLYKRSGGEVGRLNQAVDRIRNSLYQEGKFDETFMERQDLNGFPREYSVRRHPGKMDLATLCALTMEDPDSLYQLAEYQNMAMNELGNGRGKIRFQDDLYRMEGGVEAVWPMSVASEAIQFAKHAKANEYSPVISRAFRVEATKRLQVLQEYREQFGYVPEMFIARPDGLGYEPSENDLLWNRALEAKAAALLMQA